MKSVKRVVIIGAVIIAVLLVAMGIILLVQNSNHGTSGNLQVSSTAVHNVVITDTMFVPSQLIIKVGDKVSWTNNGVMGHTVTSDSGSELSSPTIAKDGTYSHTFSAAGTYSYHCAIHPSMTGVIIVQ